MVPLSVVHIVLYQRLSSILTIELEPVLEPERIFAPGGNRAMDVSATRGTPGTRSLLRSTSAYCRFSILMVGVPSAAHKVKRPRPPYRPANPACSRDCCRRPKELHQDQHLAGRSDEEHARLLLYQTMAMVTLSVVPIVSNQRGHRVAAAAAWEVGPRRAKNPAYEACATARHI